MNLPRCDTQIPCHIGDHKKVRPPICESNPVFESSWMFSSRTTRPSAAHGSALLLKVLCPFQPLDRARYFPAYALSEVRVPPDNSTDFCDLSGFLSNNHKKYTHRQPHRTPPHRAPRLFLPSG